MSISKPKVYIIILNYKTWADTIECLESVLRNDYENYQVIVVDNDSPNNSMEYIKAWADGKLDVFVSKDSPLRNLSYPPIPKPISYLFYTKDEIELLELENKYAPLIFIKSDYNGGFSYGNNLGIKYALKKDDFDYVWLLNNDTVIEKDALKNLVDKALYYKKQNKKIGIIGSKILYYDKPKIIQSVGCKMNKFLGTSSQIGELEKDMGQYDNEDIVKEFYYITGASMFITKDFLKDVGLLSEDYFLYYEEPDLAERGRKKGYSLGYSFTSRVYHKEGSTIGSSSKGELKSELSDYYSLKNRVVFMKKFYPYYLPIALLGFIVVIINRVKREQFNRLKTVLKALKDGLFS